MSDLRQCIWAVGGGKGGVGKSVITLMLAAWLGRLGQRVVLVDADLGGANLHTMLGIRYPQPTLDDFINRRVEDISEVALQTALANVRLISGADDILGLANPKWAQKMRLLRHLENLEADHVLLDLGAGTGFNTLDFFTWAAGRLIVFTPQAPSIQNAYGYVKSALFRRLGQLLGRDPEAGPLVQGLIDPQGEEGGRFDSVPALKARLKQVSPEAHERLSQELASWNVYLVANMVRDKQAGEAAARVIRTVALNYLGLEMKVLGTVGHDPEVERHVNRLLPLLQGGTASQAALASYAMANELLKATRLARVAAQAAAKADSERQLEDVAPGVGPLDAHGDPLPDTQAAPQG